MSDDLTVPPPVGWIDGHDLQNLAALKECGTEPVISHEPVSEYDVPLYSAERIAALAAQRAELLEALREVSQALALQCFGECRGFSERLMSPTEAIELSRATLAKIRSTP